MAKNYDEVGVIRSLTKVNGVKVVVSNKTVIISPDSCKAGNSTFGKIDYLVNYCGYTKIFNKVNEKTKVEISDEAFDELKKKAKSKIKLAKIKLEF